MRCTYYNNFALQGLPSLRSLDGQLANAIGNPQFRSGQFWNRSRGHGIEIAEGTTNLVLDGDFNSITNWANNGTPTTKELSATRSIFGSFSCHIITDATLEGIRQSKDLIASTQYTISGYVYVKTGSVQIQYYDGTKYEDVAVSTIGEWIRITKTFTTSGTVSGGYFNITSTTATSEFWVDGFQCEQKSYATPFDSVNVDGSTARSAQYLKIPTAGNFPGMSGGTILAVVRPDFAYNITGTDGYFVFEMGQSSSDYWLLYYRSSSDQWSWSNNIGGWNEAYSAAQTFGRGDKILIITNWSGAGANNFGISVNGASFITTTQTNVSTIPGYMTIGSTLLGSGNELNGVIDEFAIFDEPFTSRMASHVYNELFSKGKSLLKAGFLG